MQKSLAVKSTELQTKNDAANLKLKQMVKDQQEAEKQRTQSQEVSALLEKQKVEIAIKKKEVRLIRKETVIWKGTNTLFVPIR